MAILMAIVLVAIGSQVIVGMYALINPYMEEMGNLQNYNIAYYGAIAGVERAELVLKGHTAGFEGSGGWLGVNKFGADSDKNYITRQNFGNLALTSQGNSLFWEIKSRTNGTIPEAGKGDLDPDISSGQDYVQLAYNKPLQIALYKDDTTNVDDYYTGYDSSKITDIKFESSLDVSIKVPDKLYDNYTQGAGGPALDENSDVDLDGDGVKDDIVVNRTLFGLTGTDEFTIFPTVSVANDNTVNADDTTIRESVINDYINHTYNVKFKNSSSTNPIVKQSGGPSDFNQSPEGAVSTGFNKIIGTSSTPEKMHLKFSLVNFLKYNKDSIYPYLEIKIENTNSSNKEMSDSYFHIKGEGKVGKYDVRIIINKPVFETTAASDFTVLF